MTNSDALLQARRILNNPQVPVAWIVLDTNGAQKTISTNSDPLFSIPHDKRLFVEIEIDGRIQTVEIADVVGTIELSARNCRTGDTVSQLWHCRDNKSWDETLLFIIGKKDQKPNPIFIDLNVTSKKKQKQAILTYKRDIHGDIYECVLTVTRL